MQASRQLQSLNICLFRTMITPYTYAIRTLKQKSLNMKTKNKIYKVKVFIL